MNTLKTSAPLSVLGRGMMIVLLALAWGIVATNSQDANPPERLTYQGYLADGDGKALGDPNPKNYDVVFRIYDKPTDGTLKWSEQQTLTVDKGYYSVLLGEGAQVGSDSRPALSTLFAASDASDRFVEVMVKGVGVSGANVTVAPRLRLLTSPYTFLAKQALQIVNPSGTSILTADATTVNVVGNVIATGDLKGATLNVTGQSTVASVGASGDVVAAGKVQAGWANIFGDTATGSLNAVGAVRGGWYTGGSIDVTGVSRAGWFETVGSVTASIVAATWKVTGGNFVASTDVISPAYRLGSRGGIRIEDSVDGNYLWSSPFFWGPSGGRLGIDDSTTKKVRLLWDDKGLSFFDNIGLTASVQGGDLVLFDDNNKDRTALLWRSDAGFNIRLKGNHNQGSADKEIKWDGDGNWDYPSDRRLKTNIVNAEGLLDRVMAVQMRRFRWKGGSPEARPELGVIAQEFQPLFPELVSQQPPDKNQPDCPDGVMSVGLTSLGTIAIKAIQELKQEKDKEIAELRKETVELKNEIVSLKARAEIADNREVQFAQLMQEIARLKNRVAIVENPSRSGRTAEVAGIDDILGTVAKP